MAGEAVGVGVVAGGAAGVGVDAAGVDAAGVDAAGVDAAGVDAAGVVAGSPADAALTADADLPMARLAVSTVVEDFMAVAASMVVEGSTVAAVVASMEVVVDMAVADTGKTNGSEL